ncbi:acetyltransferase [Paenisporosarcina quisquiliarum]|uniref:Acetyltransferase n=1 Tax=Paenisporosarcina quisquiliarum TaxID=365346 RepID=A0A9X3LGN8_9BACL|nr:GNAT family N-acetyltransferase [Paenisporosarcina quisquiliarum]MCZ8537049.1 acetyltransferase [Paenisporosarcina quisquiliarum]
MIYKDGYIKVRELREEDNHLLAKWLSDPEVLQYYEGRDNPFDLEKVNEKFYNCDENEMKCMIVFDSVEIGYIQFYKLDEETRNHYGYIDSTDKIYGMDQFIGETNYWNKGVGTDVVKSMVTFLIKQKHADLVVMDPQTWNERAIRCYEKCGFKKAALLPKNELHEGEYRDCWLIEYRR